MKKKDNILNEHLRKIKYRTGYKVNESPRYRPLIDTNEEFDQIPTNEVEADDPNNKPDNNQPATPPPAQNPTPSSEPNGQPNAANVGMNAPVPEFDAQGEQNIPPVGNEPMQGTGTSVPPEQGMMPPINPQKEVDTIQNEIIRHNIEAMKNIHNELEALNNTVEALNSKITLLNADVQEVREPSNGEKLMSKTNVSYPYYFNLNDFWKGNAFDEKFGNNSNEKGIKELPDGTYIADFDDLPQKSKMDVQNSFNTITESNKK